MESEVKENHENYTVPIDASGTQIKAFSITLALHIHNTKHYRTQTTMRIIEEIPSKSHGFIMDR